MEEKRNEYVLEVTDLKKYFPVRGQKEQFVKAIDGINFKLKAGETLGLVGESGSGKSTTAYNVIGMEAMTEGQVCFKGQDISMPLAKRPLELKKEIQIVFQDPGTSLNPQRNIFDILSLPLKVHKVCGAGEYVKYVARLMDIVELPYEYMYKYPSTLSGGERQMVAIARALATNPSMIILDEPTSALDVSVQAKIINTLLKLQKELNLTYLFITHDLSLMRNVSTRVAIMYLGKIAEIAPTESFFQNPQHPYTKMLLSSIPVVTEAEEALKPTQIHSEGEIPSPVNVPKGCSFNTRCPFVMEICRQVDPQMVTYAADHTVRCHLCKSKMEE
ncbi:MAG: ABC transporter ATP-binding protein [Emergencia timonensis]|uniref:ABC transporter ATP-binding protein n=1 Tax=Emergencia timonensis TaxID=1776384 RepID=UPI0008318393|nr:ABC transporter ATP-binding protein [Emergencia timonensis]WNX88095.1 ABC transporter ATP-binding protein [Emergencia timonensis]